MKPLEYVWLAMAVLITAQQLIGRDGVFDPVAFAAIAFFVGMIPAGRADRRKKNGNGNGNGGAAPTQEASEAMKAILREYLEKGRGGK